MTLLRVLNVTFVVIFSVEGIVKVTYGIYRGNELNRLTQIVHGTITQHGTTIALLV